MKKLFFFAGFVLFFTNAHSQLTKGSWLVGGNASFSSDRSKSPNAESIRSNEMSVLPNIGLFLRDKFAVGISPGLSFIKSKGAMYNSSVTTYSVGPFVRYYFLPVEKTANLLVQGRFGYAVNRFNNIGSISNTSNLTYGFAGGPVIFFNESAGMEFLLGWYDNKNIEDDSHFSSFNFGIGFQIHLNGTK